MKRWKTSKNGIILINYFHLKFKPKADHKNNYQKYLSCVILKNICSENFLLIIIKVSVAESIFSRISCFQHIFLNTLRRMHLNYENCSLRSILLLVVSRPDVHFVLSNLFVSARSGAQVKLCTRKIGRLERNLSTPDLSVLT